MTTDATDLLNKYGSCLAVAKAYLSGEIPEKKDFVFELVTIDDLRAVRVYLGLMAIVEDIHKDIYKTIFDL
ncbi:MAG: hypothetical protein WAP52_03560 [Candidatus Sungiibacteriota bacterium]